MIEKNTAPDLELARQEHIKEARAYTKLADDAMVIVKNKLAEVKSYNSYARAHLEAADNIEEMQAEQ